MRKILLATTAAFILTAPMVASVKADETTIIKKDNGLGDHKTIIKKHEDRDVIRPRDEKKVIIDHN